MLAKTQAKPKLTADEVVNIQLRVAAGEPAQEVADDYDVGVSTIYYHCRAKERETRRVRAAVKAAAKRADTVEVARRLRRKLVDRYVHVTGRDLVTDLLDDREGRKG